MLPNAVGRRNPYIAGRALDQPSGFFGRDDVLRLVESELQSEHQSAVVLFGQRRIGKTSILLQLLRRLPSPPFVPVYFDLMDRAQRPLSHVLFELASTIAARTGVASPPLDAFDEAGSAFRQSFLPSVYDSLGEAQRLVLLFDEFDVLDIDAEEHLPPTAASRAFFPYLRQLMQGEPRLGFVFVVGRRAEDLSISVKATFKAARYKRVTVLDETTARELVTTAERQGTLILSEDAVARIVGLTGGHPYFTQLLCQILWNDANAPGAQGIGRIGSHAVESTAPRAVEAGQNILEWIWDGLPPAERVIFAAIAQASEEGTVVSEDTLLELLQRHGIRILTKELELAPRTLISWEMLRHVDGGYGFQLELMRRWVAQQKPLPLVKDELDRIVPLADSLYRTGNGFYRQGELDVAADQLQRALRLNPNHLKARLLLGQVLQEQGRLSDSVTEFEEAYRYDEDAARYPLARALLLKGHDMERAEDEGGALVAYERVLAISPREKVAQERIAGLWSKRGDLAMQSDNLNAALLAYEKAGSTARVAAVKERLDAQESERIDRETDVVYEDAEACIQRGDWETAIQLHSRLTALRPLDERWAGLVERATLSRDLENSYKEGCEAYFQGRWHDAQRHFASVVYARPDYRQAASRLAQVVDEQRRALLPRSSIFSALARVAIPLAALMTALRMGYTERSDGSTLGNLYHLAIASEPGVVSLTGYVASMMILGAVIVGQEVAVHSARRWLRPTKIGRFFES
jgi:tetratricopeptide (TPR) repeat protein